MDFLQPIQIFGIVTQGRANALQWVKSFTIEYGNLTDNFRTIGSNQQREMVNQFFIKLGQVKTYKSVFNIFLKWFCFHFRYSYFAG